MIDPGADDEETAAIRAFNDALAGDRRVDISLVPIGDGLLLARKKG
uniref:O-methyltransferase n=1 Tax=Candidatus Kentrum sp. DK TaxID=2126562 RepID=A0A450SHF6_9GAMM|nr:MAG: O-methyltransferase [Candidatus Kentron sp. DK]